jgi:hypothetical protein
MQLASPFEDFYGGPYHPISLSKKDQYGKRF